MRKNPTRTLAFLLSLAVCLAGGCAHRSAAPQAKPLTQQELDVMLKKQVTGDPVLRSQTDFGLVASPAGPDRVQVTVTNKTTHEIVVGPHCFALIPAGTRQTVTPNIAQSIKLFPVVRVRPGEQASGLLVFSATPIEPGAKLAFKQQPPDMPAMALIR